MGWAEQAVVVCDPCGGVGTETPATFSGVVSLGEEQAWLDLCAPHEETYLGMVRYAMTSWGQWPPPGPRLRYACPMCSKSYRYRSSLRNHCLDKHSTSLTEVELRWGRVIPEGADPGTRHRCTQQGCQWFALAPAGLATHLKTEHGITPADRWADPDARSHRRKVQD